MAEEVDAVVFIAVVLVLCRGADGRDMFEEIIHLYIVFYGNVLRKEQECI